MSFQAMNWAIAQHCGSAATKMVLLMLANHTNGHTGQCNPRHKMLADECEMRVEALKGHLKKLADLGLVEIVPQFMDGVQLPNHYRLNLQGGGGEKHPEGGGDFRMGGGGENRTTYNQELNQEDNQRRAPKAPAATPDGFAEFWAAWPNTERKANKKGCMNAWKRKKLDSQAQAIMAHVEALKQSKKWKDGFEPAPMTYLSQERWSDGVKVEAEQDDLRALFARAE